MREWLKKGGWVAGSFLAAIAPGMDLTVQRTLRPDAVEAGGYVHQLIGRTFESLGTDRITLTFMMLAMLWLLKRYLYRKPEHTGVGEYLLCGFLSVMQLLNEACNQAQTVAVLYENVFQMAKAALYLAGIYLLFLCALRALNELLSWKTVSKRWKLWDRHPFGLAFAALCIAWLPHIIIKYPGVLTVDTVLQYHQYMNWRPHTTPHPPVGQLFYGWLIDQGFATGQSNLFYFAFTLLKTAAFIAVLAYSLAVMNRRKVPTWICALAFVLYAASPVYVGWVTVLSKDSTYLIAVVLVTSLMMETVGGIQHFLRSRCRIAALITGMVLMMLVRHNGITIALPILLVMCIRLWKETKAPGMRRKMLCMAGAVLALGIGIEQAIIAAMDIQHVSQDDWLALPFQQTARIIVKHGDEIPQEERAVISRVLTYETVPDNYKEANSDGVRYTAPADRTDEDVMAYLPVWWKQVCRYPATAVDAVLHMNGFLLDLQDNNPIYISLTDHELTQYVYRNSFNDMRLYNREALVPLNGWQRALTEWYYQFDSLPGIGLFASMGFCMELLIGLCYFAVVHRRRGMLCVLIPGIVTGITGFFCPIVYTRYLMPMMAAVPVWFAAWHMAQERDE